jgi:hypothetical protein
MTTLVLAMLTSLAHADDNTAFPTPEGTTVEAAQVEAPASEEAAQTEENKPEPRNNNGAEDPFSILINNTNLPQSVVDQLKASRDQLK